MAMWPQTLPQYVIADGYQRSPRDPTLRFEPTVGPVLLRRRESVRIIRETFIFHLPTQAAVTTFQDFHDSALNFGVLPFTFNDPITGTPRSYRIIEPYQIQPLNSAGTAFQVTLNVEHTEV